MKSQKLDIFKDGIPEELKERYLIKRIKEDDIEISLDQRDKILKMLESGVRFIQIDKYTLMLNSIKSIDPKWGSANIPPRPNTRTELNKEIGKLYITNQRDLDLWDYLYGNRLD